MYTPGHRARRWCPPALIDGRNVYPALRIFLDPAYRERLTVPVLPFEKIDEIGAGMYRGHKRLPANEAIQDAPGDQSGMGGASPTRSLSVV